MRERFFLSLIVTLIVSWVFGLINVFMALAGPFLGGIVFVRFRAGVKRRSPTSGAIVAALAVGVMAVPIVLFTWVLAVATGAPGESSNLLEALINFVGIDSQDRLLAGYYLSFAIVAGAAGGGLAAWLHGRQLDSEYWVTEE